MVAAAPEEFLMLPLSDSGGGVSKPQVVPLEEGHGALLLKCGAAFGVTLICKTMHLIHDLFVIMCRVTGVFEDVSGCF